MNKRNCAIYLRITFALTLWSCSRTSPPVIYLDKDRPGLTPKVFARDHISLPQRYEQNITMAADGKEYYYGTASGKDWWYESIFCTKMLANGSSVTDTVPFVKNFKFEKEKFIGEPFLSPDGRQLFFVAGLPPNIWVSHRKENGDWNTPRMLAEPVNSYAGEWNPTVSANGTLYFASSRTDSGTISKDGRIYKAALKESQYEPVELLKGKINLDDAGDPCIAPDESYLVFSSWRKGGYGGTDLYYSRQEENGEWTLPVNLGAALNTPYEEVGPRISPDGKYLFFHRRDKWQDATYSDIYWVDIKVLETAIK